MKLTHCYRAPIFHPHRGMTSTGLGSSGGTAHAVWKRAK